HLGVLFPNELYASLEGGQGVRMDRDFTNTPASNANDTADCFRFEVLQSRDYFFSVTDTGLGGNLDLTLFDASGKSITLIPQGGGLYVPVTLEAGVYTVRVGDWSSPAPGSSYEVRIYMATSPENPTPLTLGPAPVLTIRFINAPPSPGSPSPLTPPSSDGPAIVTGLLASFSTNSVGGVVSTVPSEN